MPVLAEMQETSLLCVAGGNRDRHRHSGEPSSTSSLNKIFNTCNLAVSLPGKQWEQFSPEQEAVCVHTLCSLACGGGELEPGSVATRKDWMYTSQNGDVCTRDTEGHKCRTEQGASIYSSVFKSQLHTIQTCKKTLHASPGHVRTVINKLPWSSCLQWKERRTENSFK